jgi:hypothetical protein
VQGTEAAAHGHAEWRSRPLIGGDPTERLYFDFVAVAGSASHGEHFRVAEAPAAGFDDTDYA